jgi:stalled ribosome rescue protein Dom34
MTSHLRAAVWLDHHEARVFHVDLDTFDETAVRSPRAHVHRHPKGGAEVHNHPDDIKHYFQEVAKALADAGEILILGPSTAKLQFVKYVHEHDKALAPKIVGLETVDHPTDAQLVAYVKKYFHEATPRLR